MEAHARCGFINPQGVPCDEPAVVMALVTELGEFVPACAECAEGRQTKQPQGGG